MTKLLIGGGGRMTSKSYTNKRRIILQREREISSRDFPEWGRVWESVAVPRARGRGWWCWVRVTPLVARRAHRCRAEPGLTSVLLGRPPDADACQATHPTHPTSPRRAEQYSTVHNSSLLNDCAVCTLWSGEHDYNVKCAEKRDLNGSSDLWCRCSTVGQTVHFCDDVI